MKQAMQHPAIRLSITVGVVLAASGAIAAAPPTVPPLDGHRPAIQLTAGAEDITLDFLRHGQSTDDVNNILGTLPPGAHLSDLGEQQAHDVAQAIQQEFPDGIAGIYASELIRTQETAAALAQLPGMPSVQVLPDLDEIPAGIFEEHPRNLITEASFFFPMAAWMLGFLFVPEPGTTYNGAVFEEQVNSAVDTIYSNTIAGGGPMTDVAVSSGGDIAIWTLMNVKNPDFWPIIQSVLENGGPPPNVGQAILEGNPTDGWTLVSWDGTPVPQTPGPLIGLLAAYHDLVIPPQLALWNMWEAMQGGDQADITSALGDSTGMAADPADSVGSVLAGLAGAI